MNATGIAPIVRSTIVHCPADVAFEFYTARMSDWWPLRTHSVGADTTVRATVEPRVGGRIFETSEHGEIIWGEIILWEPPHRLVHSWHPGRPHEQATEVEVVFAAHPDGTKVTIEHREWHRLGAEAVRLQAQYSGDSAWGLILELLKKAVEEGEKR